MLGDAAAPKKQHPQCIQEELAKLDRMKEDILEYIEGATDAEACAGALYNKQNNLRVFMGSGSGSLNGPLLFMDVEDAKEVTPVMRWLGNIGWHKATAAPEDFPEAQRRTWYLRHETKKMWIVLGAFFKGETCKFVKTGEKTEPVYELKCEPEKV